MSEPEREPKQRKPMWNSRKAWALVLGGMLVVGAVNVYIAVRHLPSNFDKWDYTDAAVPATNPSTAPAQAPAAPTLDAGVSDSR